MTAKPIHYSTHAVTQMRTRGYTRRLVREILAVGTALPPVHARNATYFEKWLRVDGQHLAGPDVGVVYVENAARILVISVEPIDWRRRSRE